jgi:hypothetical protein
MRGLDLWFKNTKAGTGSFDREARMIANPEDNQENEARNVCW